jgi:uncharacterized Rmd1/YagE family protein
MVKDMSPYNSSMFKLRFEYPNTFRSLWLQDVERVRLEIETGEKPYIKELKIIYQLNILLSVSQENGKLVEALANSDELSVFETDVVRDIIDFKWKEFANSVHYTGFLAHFSYVLLLSYYINETYLRI